MPASSAASTTTNASASSIRPPKLLHPRPTTDASRAPMERVCMRPAWPSRPHDVRPSRQTAAGDLLRGRVVGLVGVRPWRFADQERPGDLVARNLRSAVLL